VTRTLSNRHYSLPPQIHPPRFVSPICPVDDFDEMMAATDAYKESIIGLTYPWLRLRPRPSASAPSGRRACGGADPSAPWGRHGQGVRRRVRHGCVVSKVGGVIKVIQSPPSLAACAHWDSSHVKSGA
jgi:hypothetical protein